MDKFEEAAGQAQVSNVSFNYIFIDLITVAGSFFFIHLYGVSRL